MRNRFRSQSRNPGCVNFAVVMFVIAGVLALEVFTGLPRGIVGGIVGTGLEIYRGIVNPIDEFFDTFDQETGFRLTLLGVIVIMVVLGILSFRSRNDDLSTPPKSKDDNDWSRRDR